MEYLPNGFTLSVPDGCFPLSTDSMTLAWFAGIKGKKTVMDLGSGCGTLGLLVCSSNPLCQVTGIELDEVAHAAALENIRANGLDDRLQSICMDLCRVPAAFAPGSFSCCISNPPYFSGGPAAKLTQARREEQCRLEDVIRAAAWVLKYGGDFFLVHRPERLGEIIALGARFGLEAKRLGLVRHTQEAAVSLVLVQMRKGGKPGLKMEDIVLKQNGGKPSAVSEAIYHTKK